MAAITQLFSAVYNALADMVAAILDSGTIQHQRAELQKDLAIDFAKEAFAMLSRSGLSSSSLEYRQCAAFLQYLGGMATAEQVCLDPSMPTSPINERLCRSTSPYRQSRKCSCSYSHCLSIQSHLFQPQSWPEQRRRIDSLFCCRSGKHQSRMNMFPQHPS